MRRFLPYKTVLGERASTLRKAMTQPEQKLWRSFLREHQPRFRRQRTIKTFIVDFYCPAAKLVIEVDGESHFTEEGKARDTERTAVLEGLGLYVLRFTNREVMQEFEGACQRISEVLTDRGDVGPPSIPPVRGEDNHEFPIAEDGLPFTEEAENHKRGVEDKNSLPNREGQGRVKPQLTTGSRYKS
jgi:very-short-patch-repair endonuclease